MACATVANQGAACTSKNAGGNTSDCPAPAAVAGAGGQRCYRGTNNGAVCNVGGDCPGGLCAQFIGNIAISLNPLTTGTATLSNASGLFCPGQTATQHGAFNSAICQTGVNSGKPCINGTTVSAPDVANCGAAVNCRPGNLTNYCSAGTNNGLGCSVAADCGTGGVCSRAGTNVQLIREVGSPASGGLPRRPEGHQARLGVLRQRDDEPDRQLQREPPRRRRDERRRHGDAAAVTAASSLRIDGRRANARRPSSFQVAMSTCDVDARGSRLTFVANARR